jgi:hypothetical protein
MTEHDGVALCFFSLCLDEPKRRALDISYWPPLIVSVPVEKALPGKNDHSS